MNATISIEFERVMRLVDMTVPEVGNKSTISGSIEIASDRGVIHVTFLAPISKLDAIGLGDYPREQYDL